MKRRALHILLVLVIPTLLGGALAAQDSVPESKGADRQGNRPVHNITSIPEPGLLVAVGGGILALALVKRKRR